MSIATLIAITLSCIMWSLWIRRVTWSCRWEVAATLNIALQGVAVLLMSPWASETIGQVLLHADRQVESSRTTSDTTATSWRRRQSSTTPWAGSRTTTPCSAPSSSTWSARPPSASPCLLATFSMGNGAAVYRPDFFQVPTDFWLSAYWILLCGTLLYLLGYGARAMLVLPPRSEVPPDRQHLPVRVGERDARLHDPDRHVSGTGVAAHRERSPGVGFRVRLRRHLRARFGTLLANQDPVAGAEQSVTTAGTQAERAHPAGPGHHIHWAHRKRRPSHRAPGRPV